MILYINQEELAMELLKTNTTEITIIGLLLVICFVFGYVIVTLYKRCKNLEDLRVGDKEKNQDVILELADKTNIAINQVTEIAKLLKE